MRALIFLATSLALLAGCSSPESSLGDVVEPEGGAAPMRANNTATLLLDYEQDYGLTSAIASTTMAVPDTLAYLHARLFTSTVVPCGAVVGEPDQDLDAWVEFVSPSGQATRMPATTVVCPGVVAVQAPSGVQRMDAVPGEWTINFGGRGLAHLRLVVDGESPQAW